MKSQDYWTLAPIPIKCNAREKLLLAVPLTKGSAVKKSAVENSLNLINYVFIFPA